MRNKLDRKVGLRLPGQTTITTTLLNSPHPSSPVILVINPSLLCYDVAHLLEEHAVLPLDVGEALFHESVLLRIRFEVGSLLGHFVVDGAFHVTELGTERGGGGGS